jgi:hypothetical protein
MAFKGSEHIAAKVYTDNISTVIQQKEEFNYLECSVLCTENNSEYIQGVTGGMCQTSGGCSLC